MGFCAFFIMKALAIWHGAFVMLDRVRANLLHALIGFSTLEIGVGVCVCFFFYNQSILLFGLVALLSLFTEIVLEKLLVTFLLIGFDYSLENATFLVFAVV